MFISAQLVSSVDDLKDQKQIDALARELRDNILSSASKALVVSPNKNVVPFMQPIVRRETVTRLYDGAAKQVEQTTLLHFGAMPSGSRN